ncbi:class I SAM-dependent methyltransferase [Bacillus sp. FJAT-49736]|uniref:class I SAM-dependent methyltransferase n=1 Tax=Bacillus sp. FJAT-49736 TaxID=2833582 RepID=UPI001BC8DB9B|nr:class I SAM-dependent methyltransferase [Bacillus sp. FJAT-49736]MBS4172642.1 class I SAM-dependent methyltransferase [Bacillus sp. FJAT-49736]
MKSTYQDALASYGIGGAHPGGLHLTKQILENEKITTKTSILDAGCGTGQTSAYLADRYKCQVTAIDHHPIMVEKARQRFIRENLSVPVIQGSIEELPYPDESFDIVIAESVTAFTNINKSLKEFYRVLKSNGILIDLDMNAEGPLSDEEKQNICTVYGMDNVLTEKEWMEEMKSAGFSAIERLAGSSIHIHLQQPQPLLDPEFHMSPNVSPDLVSILFAHNELTNMYGHLIGFRVFRAKKEA